LKFAIPPRSHRQPLWAKSESSARQQAQRPQLNGEIVRIVSAPELKERLATLGLDPVGSTPEAFAQQLRAEEEKWAKVDPRRQHQGAAVVGRPEP
jgi:hypothetical protein